jgi:hypothetical protein
MNKGQEQEPGTEMPDFEAFQELIRNAAKQQRPSKKNTFLTYIKNHNTADILNYLIGLQLIPENHGKNLRIEQMITSAFQLVNAKESIEFKQLKKEISKNYPDDSMEDPPEGLFTESVLFHGGNYIVMPGISSRSADVFRAIAEAIFILPNTLPKAFVNEVYQGATLLLEIGKKIISRAGLEPNVFVEDGDNALALPDELTDYSLSMDEVKQICVDKFIPRAVFLNCVTEAGDPNLQLADPDLNPILYKPLVILDDRVFFPIISSQLLAINEFTINAAIRHNCSGEFLKCYHDLLWNDALVSCEYMGWSLTDIQLPEPKKDYNIREAVLQFDRNKLCYLVFPERKEIEDKYQEHKTLYQTAGGRKVPDINERVKLIPDFFYSEEQFEGKDIMIMFLIPEIGRNGGHGFEKPKNGEEMTWFNVFNFNQLTVTEKWNNLSLYKYAKAYRQLTSHTQLMSFDPIDAYSTYKSKDDSFYLNDEMMPDFLSIMPGTGADIFRESKIKRDFRGMLTFHDGNLGYELVERHIEYPTIYERMHVDDSTMLVLNSYNIPVWIIGEYEQDAERPFYKTVIEALAFWLDKMSSRLRSGLAELEIPLLHLRVSLDELFFKNLNFQELEDAVPSDEFAFSDDHQGKMTFFIPGQLLKLMRGATNNGERIIMKELLNGINQGFKAPFGEDELTAIIDDVMPLGPAKMILIYDSQRDFRMDPRWLFPKHLVTSAEINLLLDKLVGIINYPEPIPERFATREDKIAFCRHAVTSFLKYLNSQLSAFSNLELLKLLFQLNESIIHSNEKARVKVPAQVFCFGELEEKVKELMGKEMNGVKTSLAIRCLIEYLAAKPAKGSKVPGYDEVDKLLAIMNEVINFGMLSDAIYFNLDDPEIGLLPSGRIGIGKSFFEEKLRPFSHANTLSDVESYMENFDDRLESLPRGESDDPETDAWLDRADEAFLADWGVSYTELLGTIKSLLYMGAEKETSVVVMQKSEFIAHFLAGSAFDEEKIERLLGLITLKERKDFLTPPEGFKAEDVFPWKYNREFSVIKRPVVEFTDKGKTMLIWGIRNAETSGRQINQLLHHGRLKYGKEKINSLLGERNEVLGKDFRKTAFDWFKSLPGLQVWDFEVTIDKAGHLTADKNYGDIDILVFDPQTNIAYNVECKRTHQAKNIHEMKTEMDSYFGRDGQKKKIQKHVDRHDWLMNNQDKLAAFIGTETPLTVKSIILTSEVIPVKYIAGSDSPLPLIAFPELKRIGMKVIV